MNDVRLHLYSEAYENSKYSYVIYDENFKKVWSNNNSLPEEFVTDNIYYFDYSKKFVMKPFSEDCLKKLDKEITEESEFIYLNGKKNYAVTVLPLKLNSVIDGYLVKFESLFDAFKKNINAPTAMALHKYVSFIRDAAAEIIFNTTIVNRRLEQLEEYELIDKIDDISKTQYGTLSKFSNLDEYLLYAANDFNITTEDASEYISNIIPTIKNALREHRLEITSEIEPGIFLSVDFNRFLRVLLNIIINAVEYNISEIKKVHIEFEKTGKFAALIISDNGTGITKEKEPNIFEPFALLSAGDDHEALGLPIAKLFAEKFNGNIGYFTNSDGTIFTLRLPVASDPQADSVFSANTDYLRGMYSIIDIMAKKIKNKKLIKP